MGVVWRNVSEYAFRVGGAMHRDDESRDVDSHAIAAIVISLIMVSCIAKGIR